MRTRVDKPQRWGYVLRMEICQNQSNILPPSHSGNWGALGLPNPSVPLPVKMDCSGGGQETWRESGQVAGIMVSSAGRIMRASTGRVLRASANDRGYERISIVSNRRAAMYSVHRLVAEAFIPNPENKPQVNHINGKKSDNSITNLEWATSSDNIRHRVRVMGQLVGERSGNSKLRHIEVVAMRTVLFDNHTNKEIQKMIGKPVDAIDQAMRGKSWAHLNADFPPRFRRGRGTSGRRPKKKEDSGDGKSDCLDTVMDHLRGRITVLRIARDAAVEAHRQAIAEHEAYVAMMHDKGP